MAQRFPVPNAGSNGPPSQRYPPPSVPPNLRQYSGSNFPVRMLINSYISSSWLWPPVVQQIAITVKLIYIKLSHSFIF